MGSYSRHVGALLRKNFILRKRTLGSSLLQLLLPSSMILILLWIKISLQNTPSFKPTTVNAVYPEDSIKPFSFLDYVNAILAPKICIPKPSSMSYEPDLFSVPFMISGINILDWPVPFVKCNARLCTEDDVATGRDISDEYCSHLILALSPMVEGETGRVDALKDYIHDTYPQIQNFTQYDIVQIFNSSSNLIDYVKHKQYGDVNDGRPKVALGVEIGGTDKTFDYSIRTNATNWNSPELFGRPAMITQPPTKTEFNAFTKTAEQACPLEGGTVKIGKRESYCTSQYMYNGALTIQRLVDDFIIYVSGAREAGFSVAENGVSFVDFPSKEYVQDGFYGIVSPYVPLLLVLGLLYPFAANLRLIVQEKEFRQKELMKIMSISESAIELSWFISLYGFSFVSGCLTTLVSAFFYVKASPTLLFVFWQFTFISIVTFSMFCSAFFYKTTRATLVGLIAFFAGFFSTLSANVETGNSTIISLVSLHPITALSYGLQIIGSLEDAGVGVVPSTLTFSEYQSGYSFLSALSSFVTSSLWFGFLTWYLNRVLPGQYGKSQPWNFLFTRSFWFQASIDEEIDLADAGTSNQMTDSLKIEPTSAALRQQELDGIGVHIRGLTKQFGDKTAVSELELSMYEGQVFALLGHNGAGKTSTINMLTGMTEPTSGYAIIGGKSINTHMHEIRENLGICLQHDCLFDQLTVKEHLQFFARVKGLYSQRTFDDAEESINSSIRDVALFEKRNTKSKDLSGGMKRKLSLAIAFCGDSKVVFLDEPTSGMDPFSRRFTWNVIRQKRQGRCIILTTHFMDEADLLGDRIGIMAEGQIRTVGSSLFLKKEFGVGYQITIEKKSDLESVDKNITDIVMDAVPGATILSDVSTELSFQLPLDASGQFVGMFGNLDRLVESEEIDSYGVSITTLEEVFLMVARGITGTGDHNLLPSSLEEEPFKRNPTEQDIQSYRSEEDISDTEVFTRHVQSLLTKRALNFKRDKRAWTCSTILPCMFSLLGFLSAVLFSQYENMQPLELNLKNYNPSFEGESNRHPTTFNKPESFPCQPGTCVSQFEGYSDYCGSLTNISDTCYQTVTGNIENMLGSDSETFVIDEDVTSIMEASKQLPLNSEKLDFGSSQYGGFYFTHSTKSLINNVTNDFYGGKVKSICESSSLTNWFNCSRFEGFGFIVSTNFTALHASLLYQGLADEAIVKAAVGNDYSINMKIDPLPYTYEENQYTKAGDAFSAWFYLVLSFPFITGAFATFIVQERMSKAKHLQTVAGVKTSAYWLSSFLWDVCNYQFPLWIIVILMYSFGVESFTTSDNSSNAGTILLLFFFGPAAAGFTYLTTFLFKSPSASNMFIIVFNFFVGFAGSLVVLILKIIYYSAILSNETSNLKDIAEIIEWALRFIPSFNFAKGLLFIINVDLFARINEDSNMSVFSADIMLYELIFLVWQSILYVLAATLIDVLLTNQKIKECGMKRSSSPFPFSTEEIDDDIVIEAERVASGFANGDLVVMSELKKEYRNGKVAVDGLSIGIPPGQCFGLLGINGAGKTTTLAMLTCEFPPSSGDATLSGYSIITQADEARRNIGYCPQFDAHFMNMTGREHIELYARIKGIPEEFIHEAVASKLAEVGLSGEDGDRISSGYSGGMKRKLSVACATIGDPKILILDEPSTGMDPVSRRDLWKVISDMIGGERGTSAILTTHSMEECEALCSRIGIMAGGKLKCLGSAQYLKKRFGKGYQIEIKIKEASNSDSDFNEALHTLRQTVGTLAERRLRYSQIENGIELDETHLNMDKTIAGVDAVSGDSYLSEKILNDEISGYLVRKSAESILGISPTELAAFCTTELRLRSLSIFLEQKFQDVILREREDTRMRFEVPSEGRKISSLFETIEENKQGLFISEYGISQTTLEQVFNMHAEAAEKMKEGTDDK